MGTAPQTPEPPLTILLASLSAAALSPLYLAATSLNAGPTTFLSTAWQAMQFLDVASVKSAKAGMVQAKLAVNAKTIFFMWVSSGIKKGVVSDPDDCAAESVPTPKRSVVRQNGQKGFVRRVTLRMDVGHNPVSYLTNF